MFHNVLLPSWLGLADCAAARLFRILRWPTSSSSKPSSKTGILPEQKPLRLSHMYELQHGGTL